MKWKKAISIVCMALSLLAVTACGGQQAAQNGGGKAAGTAAAEKAPAKAKKVLVVYYTNTHRTEQVAKAIAGETGGDLYLLDLENPIRPCRLWDYNKQKCLAPYKEHDDPSLRNVALKNAKPANWQDYDTVFAWHHLRGIAAWPMDTFVKSNDFTGKTVIPFATAYSSGLGSSADQLKEMAGSKGNLAPRAAASPAPSRTQPGEGLGEEFGRNKRAVAACNSPVFTSFFFPCKVHSFRSFLRRNFSRPYGPCTSCGSLPQR